LNLIYKYKKINYLKLVFEYLVGIGPYVAYV